MVEQRPINNDAIQRYLEAKNSLRNYHPKIASWPGNVTFTLPNPEDAAEFKLALENQLKLDDSEVAARINIYEPQDSPGDVDISSVNAFRAIITNFIELETKILLEEQQRLQKTGTEGKESKERKEEKKAQPTTQQKRSLDLERYLNWKSVIETLVAKINKDTKEFPAVFLTDRQLQTLQNFKTELEKNYKSFCEAHKILISSVERLNEASSKAHMALLGLYQKTFKKLDAAIGVETRRIELEEKQKRSRAEFGIDEELSGNHVTSTNSRI